MAMDYQCLDDLSETRKPGNGRGLGVAFVILWLLAFFAVALFFPAFEAAEANPAFILIWLIYGPAVGLFLLTIASGLGIGYLAAFRQGAFMRTVLIIMVVLGLLLMSFLAYIVIVVYIPLVDLIVSGFTS